MPTPQKMLAVPYESQHDNESGEGYRECFTSTCGAIARFWGRVSGDDAYARIRANYGDTTNPAAQERALRHLGLQCRFITNGTPEIIRAEIDAGRPVAVGWIHKGALPDALWGSGHWSAVIGYTGSHAIHHDPYGEADILRGGYVNLKGGAGVAYSWRNWRQRWEVMPVGRGYRHLPGNGWALLISP